MVREFAFVEWLRASRDSGLACAELVRGVHARVGTFPDAVGNLSKCGLNDDGLYGRGSIKVGITESSTGSRVAGIIGGRRRANGGVRRRAWSIGMRQKAGGLVGTAVESGDFAVVGFAGEL